MVNYMRFAVRIHQNGWSYQELEEVWRESERLGYDGASLYDVLGIDGPECWTALTALTARTRRLVSVPLVLSNPYRHPAVVAKMAATLDAVSPGRVMVGIGAGGSGADAAAFGVPWPPPAQRIEALAEAVQVMRAAWSGGGSFRGRWYQLREAPAYRGGAGAAGAVGAAPPPILIGGHGPRLIRTAAQHADLANIGFDLPPREWHRLRRTLATCAREAGRAPESPVLTHNATVLLGSDEADFSRLVSAWASRRGLSEEAARRKLEHALAGTAHQVRAKVKALEAAGVGWVFLLFDDARDVAALRLFAEAVMGQP
jgi:alkanesulfonate monooxygenase SsuD/methylene tetrahydromethanopterin reductase-like flavin-dependent oxidoreductase (luciferase family)